MLKILQMPLFSSAAARTHVDSRIHVKAPSKLDKLEQDTPDEGLTIESWRQL